MGLEDEDIPDEWYCSDRCKELITRLCCGKLVKGAKGRWIGCDAGTNCLHREWYHLGCKKLKRVPGRIEFYGVKCQA